MVEKKPVDEVLDALEALLGVLQESTRRNHEATKQANAIRRLRRRGRSYREILSRDERAQVLQSTRDNLDHLLETCSRLRRAEARALYTEGLTMEEIASMFGVTRQRVSVLLQEEESSKPH